MKVSKTGDGRLKDIDITQVSTEPSFARAGEGYFIAGYVSQDGIRLRTIL